ncbi:MAG: hypothetical protein KDG50_10805 [Chromatiales bacterium]|nr:hypothetical protein [Chromatiales bacterium]
MLATLYSLALAALAFGLPQTSVAARAIAAILLALLLWRDLSLHARRTHPGAIVRMRLLDDRTWVLTLANGREHSARLLDASVVTAVVIVLQFRVANKRRRTIILTGDSADPDQIRLLRARLSHSAATDT